MRDFEIDNLPEVCIKRLGKIMKDTPSIEVCATGVAVGRELSELVAEYSTEYRNSTLPAFTVCEPQPWKGWWGSQNSKKQGCYVIYSSLGEPMYIGKASLKATMGSRLAAHERSRDERWSDAAQVQMVIVGEPFEAPSLEEFLLSRLSTRHNILGRRKPVL